jgi:hypothetical protein
MDDDYDDYESDRPSSSEGRPGRTSKKEKALDVQSRPSNMSFFRQFLTLLEEHPNVPAILSWWAQLVVNLSLFSLAVWMVFSFVAEIRNEFDAVASKEMDSILHNIAECMKRYEDNKCAAGNLGSSAHMRRRQEVHGHGPDPCQTSYALSEDDGPNHRQLHRAYFLESYCETSQCVAIRLSLPASTDSFTSSR